VPAIQPVARTKEKGATRGRGGICHSQNGKRQQEGREAMRTARYVPRSLDGGDEELGAVRVGTGIGHGKEPDALVFERKVLVRDCGIGMGSPRRGRKQERGRRRRAMNELQPRYPRARKTLPNASRWIQFRVLCDVQVRP
jgi:hypothetical protein